METEEINHELGSSPPLPPPLEQNPHPSGAPSVSHLVPPPDPAAGGEKKLALSRIAPWKGPEGIGSSSRCGAPPGILDAPGPGSASEASTMVNPLLKLGPCGGP